MKFTKSIVSLVVLVAAVASVGAASDVSAASTKCTVKAAPLGSWGKNITVAGNKATAKFTVEGTNCTTPVTFASWIRPTAEGINDQKLYKHTTKTFAPGVQTLTVEVADCMYQVDVVEGAKATAADGTANYQYQNGKFVDGGLRDFKKGGTGTCEEKPTTPVVPEKPPVVVTPTQPTPTPATPAPTTPSPVSTTKTVESLPSTGVGSILGGAAGLGTTVTAAASFLKSKRDFKNSLK